MNDDEREGYGTSGWSVGRNTAVLAAWTATEWNANDLSREANSLSGADEVKNIIDIT